MVNFLSAGTLLCCFLATTNLFAQEVVKVSYNSAWAPFSSGTGEAVDGILPDLMQTILGEKMGLTVSHRGYPWKRAQKLVKHGDLDVLITVPTESRLQYTRSSNYVVYQFEMRVIVRKGSQAEQLLTNQPDVETLRGLKACDMSGNGWGKRYFAENELKVQYGNQS